MYAHIKYVELDSQVACIKEKKKCNTFIERTTGTKLGGKTLLCVLRTQVMNFT